MSDENPIYALIVGIDRWQAKILPSLKGCRHDAELMERVFRERFAVPEENVLLLLDEQATREGLTHGFRTHLIDRARQWSESSRDQPSPAFVFHFSGHGSRARDQSGTQPDGLDETIVPQDSRMSGVFDIKDWEIAAWLDELTQYTDNVTVILDCCHSGSGTRDTESVGTPRRCDPDMRLQPSARPIAVDADESNLYATVKATTRGTSEQQIASQRYVLLAACRNYESAEEYTIQRHLSETGERYKHGAFTWFLANELMRLPGDANVTYSELYQRVRHNVHSHYPSQTPQCEGDRDRLLFGGARVVRDSLATVTASDQDGIWIDAGTVHGLDIDSRVRVYSADTRSLKTAAAPIAELAIDSIEPTRSRCRATADDSGTKPNVPVLSRAEIPTCFSSAVKKRVSLDFEDAELARRCGERFRDDDASAYLQVLDDANSKSDADFRIQATVDGFHVRDQAGALLVRPIAFDSVEKLVEQLISICRYHAALDLHNPSDRSLLRGKIDVEFFVVDAESAGTTKTENQRRVRSVTKIATTADGTPIVELQKPIAIKVTNRSDKAVYCEAISFGYDYAIQPLTLPLTGASSLKRVSPGKSLWFGRDHSDRPLVFKFRKGSDEDRFFTEANEHLKVIATLEDTDFSILTQRGLEIPPQAYRSAAENPLTALFAQVMSGQRALGAADDDEEDFDWASVEMDYVVTRSLADRGYEVAPGATSEIPRYGLQVCSPSGFQGQIGVQTEVQATRNTPVGSERPNAICLQSNRFLPRSVAALRPSSPAGEAIQIIADSDSLQSIDRENPLGFRIAGSNDQCLAIAWDGVASYPVGSAGEEGIDVHWLPATSIESQVDPANEFDDAGQKRGLLRSVKLYLFELIGTPSIEIGLHDACFVPTGQDENSILPGTRVQTVAGGEVRMRRTDQKITPQQQNVLLVVHGFCGDGHNALAELSQLLTKDGSSQLDAYDRILTFDYESYKTPITKNAETLAKALKDLGFCDSTPDRLDVVATGMGAMVARSLIEQFGGDQYVRRCFFTGAPNRGTSLVSMHQHLPWLATAILNAGGINIAGTFMTVALKKFERDAVAIRDLVPDSEFLRSLNRSGAKRRIPYTMVAGQFNQDASGASAWYRAASGAMGKGLRVFFGGNHDLVVDVPSMTSIDGTQDDIFTVSAHHFDYFQNSAVGTICSKWVAQG